VRVFKFFVSCFVAYLSWYVIYEFAIKPLTNVDEVLISSMVNVSESGLEMLGFKTGTFPQPSNFINRLGVSGSPGVEIGAPCDGLALFALFSIFIAFYPGGKKKKVLFILLGLIVIHTVNVLRVISLAAIQSKYPNWLEFNHDYTFTILVYGVVFGLWYVWATYLSPISKSK